MPGVEVLHARFSTHRFSPHAHESWSIAAVLSGTQDNAAGSASNLVSAREVAVLRPNEAHAGMVVGDAPCHYVMVYVAPEVMTVAAAACGVDAPTFPRQSLKAPRLALRVEAFVRAALSAPTHADAGRLEVQAEWDSLLTDLVSQHASRSPLEGSEPGSSPAAALRRAQNLMLEHWNQPLALEDLAREAGLSPFHFCRQFGRAYGLTPHRYQLVLRVARARALIAQGAPVAEAALATGFADQSHLGRQFKSCFGYSPGVLTLMRGASK